MTDPAGAIVLAVLVLTTSTWVGGYVAIAVVARAATTTLDPVARVAFFRSLGRTYLRIGLPALVIALATGALLLRDREWDALLVAAAACAGALLLGLGVAVVQARRMTVLRRALLTAARDGQDDVQLGEQVRRGARFAGLLRAVLGLLSIALVVLGAFLAV